MGMVYKYLIMVTNIMVSTRMVNLMDMAGIDGRMVVYMRESL